MKVRLYFYFLTIAGSPFTRCNSCDFCYLIMSRLKTKPAYCQQIIIHLAFRLKIKVYLFIRVQIRECSSALSFSLKPCFASKVQQHLCTAHVNDISF